MRISEMFANKKPVFSLEIFPPKKQANIDTSIATTAIAESNNDSIASEAEELLGLITERNNKCKRLK